MERLKLLILTLILCASFSQAATDSKDFDKAWQKYTEARQRGKARKTLAAAEKMLRTANEVLAPDDPRMPVLIGSYALALNDAGRAEEAAEQYALALQRAEATYPPESPEVLTFVIAAARGTATRPSADALYTKALALTETAHGTDSLDYAALEYEQVIARFVSPTAVWKTEHLEKALAVYRDDERQRLPYASLQLAKNTASRSKREMLMNGILEIADTSTTVGSQVASEAHTALAAIYQRRGASDLVTKSLIDAGRLQRVVTPELVPVVRVAPRYPTRMLSQGTSGSVELSFTVDEQGFVRDPQVVALKKSGRAQDDFDSEFSEAAIEAVLKFRYVPRYEGGEAVATPGVKTTITFRIE